MIHNKLGELYFRSLEVPVRSLLSEKLRHLIVLMVDEIEW